MNDDQRLAASEPGRRDMTTTCRRPGGLAVLVAAAAIGLAACSGSPSTPQVASLGSSSGNGSGSSTTAPSAGNPTQVLDEWAACIRRHGDPNQADPTIDANKDIEITMNNVPQALSSEVHGSTGPCSNYLLAAETALRGGQPSPTYNPVTAVKFSECMRANGVPNYPDPSANGETNFRGTGVDPNSTAVQNATKTCDKKLGERYYAPGTEMPGVVIVTGCNAPAGMQCPNGGPPSGGGGNRPRPVPSGNGGSGGNG
jgi:hypothetical protein